jgi:hypothetical protein
MKLSVLLDDFALLLGGKSSEELGKFSTGDPFTVALFGFSRD